MELSMTICVEFYGIPKQRAGVDAINVEAATLGAAFLQLSEQLPQFAVACLAGGRLQPSFLANINGENFTTDPQTPLEPGDTVLILSADAGG
jgi:molybdopterin converting factor small subunit